MEAEMANWQMKVLIHETKPIRIAFNGEVIEGGTPDTIRELELE